MSTRNPPSSYAWLSRSWNCRASAFSGVISPFLVEIAVVRRFGSDEPEVTRIDASRRWYVEVSGCPAKVESDLPQKFIEFRAIRQRFSFGITALEPILDLLDREACLAVTQTQPLETPRSPPQSSFRRHATRI